MSFLTLQELVAFTMTCKYAYDSKFLSQYVLLSRVVVCDGLLRWTQRTGCNLDGVSITIDISKVHTYDAYCACFSSNGELIIGGLDGALSIWNTHNCTVTHKIVKGHQDDVNALCALDNNWIASCSNDGSVQLWSLNDEDITCEKVIKAHEDYDVCKIHVNKDGHLVSIGDDGWLKVWNLHTGECICKTTIRAYLEGCPLDCCILNNGIFAVVTTKGRGNPYILNCYDTSEKRLAAGNSPFVPNKEVHDGYELFTYFYCICALLDCDGFVICHSPGDPTKAQIDVYELIRIESGDGDTKIRIDLKMVLEGNGVVIRDVTTTIKGNLVSCSYDGSITLYRRITNFSFEPARMFQIHLQEINFVVSFPNGLGVVTGARDDRLCYTSIDEQSYS